MPALFVTATGTDIGKTFVTCGLIAELRRQGRAVTALKPVVTGFTAYTAAASDPALLLAALSAPLDDIEKISPWRFAAPLSPDLAAARENRMLDAREVVTFSRTAIAAAEDVVIIEGVGGIMVPLDERHTVLDWMTALDVSLVVVAGSYLGTISHTLSAVDVLRRRDLSIAAIVISESRDSPAPLDDTVTTIARFVRPIPVLALPKLSPGEAKHAVFQALAEAIPPAQNA